MSDAEQAAAVALWRSRHRFEGMSHVERDRWQALRNRVAGTETAAPATDMRINYAAVGNCLPDAFRTAHTTLTTRLAAHGRGSETVLRFIAGQDAVFENCTGSGVSPAPLTSGTAEAKADRAYHIAASHMYAMRHQKAVDAFREIAADKTSPWRSLAAYLVARTLVRHATLTDGTDADDLFNQAIAQVDTVLADPALSDVHPAASALRGRARYYVAPESQRDALAVALATKRLDASLEHRLADYTSLVDQHGLSTDQADRLSTWIRVIQKGDAKSFDMALALYGKTKTPVWLTAALMLAPPDAPKAVLAPLLSDDVKGSHPRFATIRYHQARLLAAQGDNAAAYRLLQDTATKLGKDISPSTRADLTEARMTTAPSKAHALKHVLLAPAAVLSEAVAEPTDLGTGFSPQAAAWLSSMDAVTLVEMVELDALPAPAQARFALWVWIRAQLLDRPGLAERTAAHVIKGNPAIAAHVERVGKASSPSDRRLGVVHLMLLAPDARPVANAWDGDPVQPRPINTAYGNYHWCGSPKATAPAWLSTDARQRAKRQQASFEMPGPNYLARAAVKLAKAMPDDDRVPEVLHLAVAATRYGCRDDKTTKRSRAAFRLLHRRYPDSPFTAKTPYHY
ncbi:MAG: hypothetical protein JKY37_24560 [Nannocystaceae bacterium]|nr:hypothetical protein [Nannocystaceae bacterium]